MPCRVLDALRTFERRSRSRSFVKIGAPLSLPLPNFLASAAPARAPAAKERALFLALSLSKKGQYFPFLAILMHFFSQVFVQFEKQFLL